MRWIVPPIISLFAVCALVLPVPSLAKPVRFDFRDAGQRNTVQFVCDGILEKTVGLTSSVGGWLDLDPDRLGDGLKGEWELDMRTFYTGLELKTEQLSEKFLAASEDPIAVFSFGQTKGITKARLIEGQPVTVRVDGQLKAKGMSKPLSLLLKLVYFKESELTRQRLSGNLLKVSASFEIDVSQYGITIPDALRVRYSRFVQGSVDVVGSDQLPTLVPPQDGPKPKEVKVVPVEMGKKEKRR